MNKKILVLVLLLSFTLVGCQQKTEESEETADNNNGAISVQPIDQEAMDSEAKSLEDSMENEDESTIEENNTLPTPVVVEDTEPKVDPKLCEVDKDCIAIPNPNNPCYKAYFNKNATEAIEEYRNQEGFMVQDCPEFGGAVCIDNQCTEKK